MCSTDRIQGLGLGCHCVLAIFESTDGGVTWRYLITSDAGDILGVVSGDDDEPQLVLWSGRSEVTLFPSGKTRTLPDGLSAWGGWQAQVLADGRVAWRVRFEQGVDPLNEVYETTPLNIAWVAEDGERLGEGMHSGVYHIWQLPDHLRPSLPSLPIPSHLHRHYLPGDDRPADWPIDSHIRYYLEEFVRLGVQQGPFLRVAGVGDDCLSLRAEPSPDAEELACAADRVLLTDLGGVVEAGTFPYVYDIERVTWLSVRTPVGIEGWADGRYLER